jgi:hypothetical protein
MKKILSICLLLIITILPTGNIFANESDIGESVDVKLEVPLDFIPNDDDNNSKFQRISVKGTGGTAALDYGSGAQQLIWRITSSTGPIISFTGDINIYDSKNKLCAKYPLMSVGTITRTGTINVKWLKRGSYRAVMTGSGVTAKGRIVVKSGASIHFTK